MQTEESGGESKTVALQATPYIVPAGLVANDALRPTLPPQLQLGTLSDGRFRVRRPIRVNISTEHGHVIAEAPEFEEYGYGANLSEAVRDFQRTLVELYFTLERDQERLGAGLRAVWAALREAVDKRP
jgi:hypothetical protein